ncbi:hypothetical protein SNEBB_005627 [Seison nebaliae]|nr:hypothetical protein SNEBB_005627 [Seison nebaliae]
MDDNLSKKSKKTKKTKDHHDEAEKISKKSKKDKKILDYDDEEKVSIKKKKKKEDHDHNEEIVKKKKKKKDKDKDKDEDNVDEEKSHKKKKKKDRTIESTTIATVDEAGEKKKKKKKKVHDDDETDHSRASSAVSKKSKAKSAKHTKKEDIVLVEHEAQIEHTGYSSEEFEPIPEEIREFDESTLSDLTVSEDDDDQPKRAVITAPMIRNDIRKPKTAKPIKEEPKQHEKKNTYRSKPDKTLFFESTGFANAQPYEVKSEIKRRYVDLLDKGIDFELSTKVNIINIHESQDYDSIMKNHGLGETIRNASIQTESHEQTTQTDEIETRNIWVQLQSSANQKDFGFEGEDEKENVFEALDPTKLNNFLKKSLDLVQQILDEEHMEKELQKGNHTSKEYNLSKDYLNHKIILFEILDDNPTEILMLAENENDQVMLIWSMYNMSEPTNILSCGYRGNTCNCITSAVGQHSQLIFGGFEDGSISMWNFKDSVINLKNRKFRPPSYQTAFVTSEENTEAIMIMECVLKSGTSIAQAQHELIAVDFGATIHIWSIVDVKGNLKSGSMNDLGIFPGSTLRLVPTIKYPLRHQIQSPYKEFQAFSITHPCGSDRHIYISSDQGCIYHIDRNGTDEFPQIYEINDNKSFLEITSIKFNPHIDRLFVVGCRNGNLYLFSTLKRNPIATIFQKTTESIDELMWDNVECGTLYAMTSNGRLLSWRMNEKEGIILINESIIDCELAKMKKNLIVVIEKRF